MSHFNHRHRVQASTYGPAIFGALCLSLASTPLPTLATEQGTGHKGEAAQLREDAETLLKGNRSVLGKVLAVTSDQIKVDIGEVQPRFLPLKQAKQKNFPLIHEGDDLIVVLNTENLLVDYHPIEGEASAHTIIRGEVAQNLTVGHDTVVIRSDGKEQTYTIRSQARSKLAAIPVNTPAVFLIDETNQIADATFSSKQSVKEAHRQAIPKPPIKGAHKQIDGTVSSPLEGNHIAVRTGKGQETPYEVRDTVQSKLAGLHKGDAVILLVDTENKVIDVAIPPHAR